jgi:carbon monoxide dehydrogenase subunit G
MAMEISKSFVVKTSPEKAWDFLIDPRRVASCLPGAAVTQDLGEQKYAGTITVKVGPVAATYRGVLRFERLDAESRTAELVASGQDVRGKGGADMRMTSGLVERAPGETLITVVSQVNVMGVLAQFGRGMIQDVSDQMFQRFVDGMRAQLETAEPGPSPAAASLPVSGSDRVSPAAAAPASAPVPPVAAPPIEVVSFGSAVIGRAAARAARRPGVWIAVAVLVAVVYWLWRR